MATNNGAYSGHFSGAGAGETPSLEVIIAQVGLERGYNDVFLRDVTGHVEDVTATMKRSGVPLNRTGISFVRDVLRGSHPAVRDDFLKLIGEPAKRGPAGMHPNYVDTQSGDDLDTQPLLAQGFDPASLRAAREEVERQDRLEKVKAGLPPQAEHAFIQTYRAEMMPGVANATKAWGNDVWHEMQRQRPGYQDDQWNPYEALMQVAIRQADLTCFRLESFAPRRGLNLGLPPEKL